jgi:dolichol-phosphate mannosyltransferase
MVRPYLSVLAPCYNEEQVLSELYRRLSAACARTRQPYELVFVNDGSMDSTWPQILGLASADRSVVGVNLARNHGHQLALTAGLSVCRGERVLIIDADLQDPPELLPDMLRLMDDGADVVNAQRRQRAGETFFKRFTASLFYRIIDKLATVSIPRDTGDFRLISRRVVDVLLAMPEKHRFVRGMVSWVGFRQERVLYDRDARFAGETKYPLRKMVKFAIDAITSFSTKPLAFAGYTGTVLCMLSILAAVCSPLDSRLGFALPSGWGMSAYMTFLTGVQLLALGVIGQYLGRLYEQSNGRPLFLIERVVGGERADTAEKRSLAA